MRQKSLSNNPRLKWVAETVLTVDSADRCSSEAGAPSRGRSHPFLTATLSGFGPEMRVTSGLSAKDTKVVEAYWRLVDEMVFGTHACGKSDRGGEVRKR